jgi:hypothetical protein
MTKLLTLWLSQMYCGNHRVGLVTLLAVLVALALSGVVGS